MTNPKIRTVGILSASNEAGRALSTSENYERDEALRRDLGGYRVRQVRGEFGRVEKPLLSMVNPLIVINMTRKSVVALGVRYHQFHVIFGQSEATGQDLAMRLELVEADGAARVLAVRKLFAHARKQRRYLSTGCPDDRGDFFVIPGFDENTPA